MSQKKVMPKGGPKASPTLWRMVRSLTEEQWEAVRGWATVYFKNPLQLQLMTLLRSMEVYDHAIEKLTFAENDLKSLRHATKRWLIRTGTRLALFATEVSGQVLDVNTLLQWGIHQEIFEFIAEAKHTATEQEEFGWLALLYEYELRTVKTLCDGEELIDRIAAVTQEAMENGKLLALKAEIEQQSALFLEKGRHTLLTTGTFDRGLAEAYFQGKFHRQRIDGWPISFQIQKLRIDEGIHYFVGNSAQAARAAEKMLPLIEDFEKRRVHKTEDHPKCLFRLSAYYGEFESKSKLMEVVERFRRLALKDTSFEHTYLRRLIYTLFHASFQFNLPTLADQAISLWKDNHEVLNRNLKDGIRFTNLLYVLAFQLSRGDIKAARVTFSMAFGVVAEFPHLLYQSVLKIFHLLLLLEEEDERGLQSYGKNYKRHLNDYLKKQGPSPVATKALEIVTLLSKESNLQGREKLGKSLHKLADILQELPKKGGANFSPFVYPMMKVVEMKAASVQLPVGNNSDA